VHQFVKPLVVDQETRVASATSGGRKRMNDPRRVELPVSARRYFAAADSAVW
jgi:hypothetical protein